MNTTTLVGPCCGAGGSKPFNSPGMYPGTSAAAVASSGTIFSSSATACIVSPHGLNVYSLWFAVCGLQITAISVPANLKAASIARSSLTLTHRTPPFRCSAIGTTPAEGADAPSDVARELSAARCATRTVRASIAAPCRSARRTEYACSASGTTTSFTTAPAGSRDTSPRVACTEW